MANSKKSRKSIKVASLIPETAGKIVASISFNFNSDWQALELAFTDGTLLSIELIPRIDLKAQLVERRRGDLKLIRDYGDITR